MNFIKLNTYKLLSLTKNTGVNRVQRLAAVPFLIILLSGFFTVAIGQNVEINQTQLSQYLEAAAQNNPELKAEYRQYLAALQQVPQVNTLPDPELSFAYFINPIETRVGPQQARFGFTQMFPWFGTLNARESMATQKARAIFESFQQTRNKLFFNVEDNWYRLYLVRQSIQILQENIQILETFESLALRRYETGQVGQVDVLRVQIEKEDLKTRMELMKDNYRVQLQQFNELLNRDGSRQVQVPDTLTGNDLKLDIPVIEQRVMQQNPQLSELNYKAASARSAVDVAQKEGMPKFGLGADYIITGERDISLTDNGRDAILGRVGIQLPLYRKKYRAKEKQARIELRAIRDREVAAQNNLQTTLEQTLRDFSDAQRRVSLYREIQIQRTRQALDILTEQYASSATDFEELLRLQRKLLDYELAHETAVVDQNTAKAFIDYLYGKYNINPEEIKTQ